MNGLLAILAGGLTLFFLYKILFRDWEEVVQAVKYWFTPDIVSAFRFEYWEDAWAEIKLLIWIAGSLSVGWSLYAFL